MLQPQSQFLDLVPHELIWKVGITNHTVVLSRVLFLIALTGVVEQNLVIDIIGAVNIAEPNLSWQNSRIPEAT